MGNNKGKLNHINHKITVFHNTLSYIHTFINSMNICSVSSTCQAAFYMLGTRKDQVGMSGDGEKCLDSGYVQKARPTEFMNRLDVVYARKDQG